MWLEEKKTWEQVKNTLVPRSTHCRDQVSFLARSQPFSALLFEPQVCCLSTTYRMWSRFDWIKNRKLFVAFRDNFQISRISSDYPINFNDLKCLVHFIWYTSV